MTRFLLRRLRDSVLVLLGVSALAFLLMELAPGDPFDELKIKPGTTQERIEMLRQLYRLDDPPVQRYLRWMWGLARGDLGFAFSHGLPVSNVLLPRMLNTLLLTVTATALAWVLALATGVWTATRKRGPAPAAFDIATSLLLAIPDLVIALLLLLLALRTGWLPTGGMTSRQSADLAFWQRAGDVARHLVLPATALVLVSAPFVARYVRSSMAGVLGSPFIRAARARGLSGRRLLFGSALPAASQPLISLAGLSVGSLLSASLLIEVIMNWPGMGPMLIEAIWARDAYLVLATVMLSSVLLVAGNLLADLLLAYVDPRTRQESEV